MRRITISLAAKSKDAETVRRALEQAPRWKHSHELIRWAAAYLNGEAIENDAPRSDGLDEAEIDALLDDF